MLDIGACDARTHLPKLLERVLRGERFVTGAAPRRPA
jgi:antitoxin (DNA-binding transcriptional repressor) of toxin-antitoxin stability system